jgi:hypothetical protein
VSLKESDTPLAAGVTARAIARRFHFAPTD